MKINYLSLVLLSVMIVFINACNSDDNIPVPPTGTVLTGTFVDFPISGLSYTAGVQSGITDAAGSFTYEAGNDITFTLGGLQLGTTTAMPNLSPLDFVNTTSVSNQVMRNITTLLFSLDQDQDPSNGSQLSTAVQTGLVGENFAMDIDHFYLELQRIVADLNLANGTNLAVVGANDATEQLTAALGISSEFEVLPRTIVGTQWTQGDYFAYNTVPSTEYVFKIGADLTNVRYHFGGGNGFLFNVTYNNEITNCLGNYYTDLNDTNPSTLSNANLEYHNLIGSPGYVFDYGPQTFLSFACFYRKTGNPGEMAGTWHSFLNRERKFIGQAPFITPAGDTEFIISDVNTAGEFSVNDKRYLNGTVVNDTTYVFSRQELDTENIMIIDMGGVECLFADTSATLFAGQLSIKQ